jgi:glycine/D-amino acid oxidase-like deaminating enzyme
VTYDLIIAGAGIVGAACADRAASEGLRVAVIEPDVIGGGATGAGMGHLVALDDNEFEFALAMRSLALWEDIAEVSEAQFQRCGTLWLAETESEYTELRSKLERLASQGRRAELLDEPMLRQLEPALAPGLRGALRVIDDAVVYPPGITQWMLRRARSRGAVVYANRRVISLELDGARLDDGTRVAGPVLVACGCASVTLLPELPIRPRKGHLIITDRYPRLIRHQLVELSYAASAHGQDDESIAFNLQPRPTGQLLLGSSREYGSATDHVSMPVLAHMLKRAFRFVPALSELKAIRAWTGFRPATPDGLPYLGSVPGRPDVWVAAGHEGLGATTALGSAELLIDLFLGRVTSLDPRPYSPARLLAAAA